MSTISKQREKAVYKLVTALIEFLLIMAVITLAENGQHFMAWLAGWGLTLFAWMDGSFFEFYFMRGK